MTVGSEPTELADGLGFGMSVIGTEPLAQLTAALNLLCEKVADHTERAVVVLRVGPMPNPDRAWPGAVGIQEVNRWERAVHRLTRLGAATIGVVDGTCAGPALDLVLSTDYRIGTTDMRLLLPINDGHFWPGMALHRLVQQVGAGMARRVIMWREDITADDAVAMAVIDRVCTDLEAAAHEATVLFGRIAEPELAIRRQLLLEAATTGFDEALGAHLAACDRELRRLSGATKTSAGAEIP